MRGMLINAAVPFRGSIDGLIPRSTAPRAVPECKLLSYPGSTEQCAKWFRDRRFVSCWHCPTGQANSGEQHSKGERACIRCSKTSHRLQVGAYCVSCWNRSIELAKGRNSKGTWPSHTAASMKLISAIVATDAASIHEALTPRRHAQGSGYSQMLDRRNLVALELHELEPEMFWVSGFFRDRDELEALLDRLLDGLFEIAEFDERPIVPPVPVS